MNLNDLKRLSITAIVAALLLVMWGVFLALHDSGRFEWGMPETALGWFGITAWMWVLVGIMTVIVGVIAMLSFGIEMAPAGYARGKMRQVQCQDCKAVFFVHDSGHRPLTHQCPSCKALGVYDGKAPSVGAAPKPKLATKLVQIGLTCHACEHKFKVTDSGHRPLKIKCPSCKSAGTIN